MRVETVEHEVMARVLVFRTRPAGDRVRLAMTVRGEAGGVLTRDLDREIGSDYVHCLDCSNVALQTVCWKRYHRNFDSGVWTDGGCLADVGSGDYNHP